MDSAWWRVLDKSRGSRPRCVLLADGARSEVADRLTDLVGLPDVTVTANDYWMPCGKPVRTRNGWNPGPAAEARLDRDDGFLLPEAQRQLRDWWLAEAAGANTPNWDLAATCNVEGGSGLVLIEAEAHAKDLSTAGKSPPRSANEWKNHEQIGAAIAQANAGFQRELREGHGG